MSKHRGNAAKLSLRKKGFKKATCTHEWRPTVWGVVGVDICKHCGEKRTNPLLDAPTRWT